jgi:hypothetical protein
VSSADSLYEKLREIRYETTAIQGKLSDVFKILESLSIQDAPRPECERCRATFAGPLSLSEHVYQAHDGPVPEHWREAEERSAA